MFLLGDPVNLNEPTLTAGGKCGGPSAGAYFNESNIVPSALVGTGLGLATRSAGWGILGAAATPLVLNAVQGRSMYGGSQETVSQIQGGNMCGMQDEDLDGGKRKSRKSKAPKKSRKSKKMHKKSKRSKKY